MELYKIQGEGNREQQEDSYHVDLDHRFFIVCDGVGGGEKGKLASSTVIESTRCWIDRHIFGQDEPHWDELAVKIHRDLRQKSVNHSVRSFIGSTAVIVILWKSGAHVLHIGDSRCYHIKQEGLSFWRTKDHSLVQELFDLGLLASEEEMLRHPRRNVVTRAFTSDQAKSIPAFSHHWIPQLESEDILFLCTDGIQEAFPGDSVVDVFHSAEISFQKAVLAIESNCQKHANDNFTAVAVKIA